MRPPLETSALSAALLRSANVLATPIVCRPRGPALFAFINHFCLTKSSPLIGAIRFYQELFFPSNLPNETLMSN